jgi:hypothetical protein
LLLENETRFQDHFPIKVLHRIFDLADNLHSIHR